MATTLKVGDIKSLSIAYFDQNGSPMLVSPTPDSAPQWGNTMPAVESVVAASDGLSAKVTALAAGSDTVGLNLSVGGAHFAATLDVEVEAVVPAQTLTSIGIVVS